MNYIKEIKRWCELAELSIEFVEMRDEELAEIIALADILYTPSVARMFKGLVRQIQMAR